MAAIRWKCPYCGHSQVATGENTDNFWHALYVGENKRGPTTTFVSSRACLNEKCRQLNLTFSLYQRSENSPEIPGKEIQTWRLLPESRAKPQPDFVPEALRNDYVQACRIIELSPKASATLSRRCLQGMIRNFCSINQPNLFSEIEELKTLVDNGISPKGVEAEHVDALHAIRELGNIGAHMKADINEIVEVDPGEAQALIEVIDMLFEEWYVARDERIKRLNRVRAIADAKKPSPVGGPENVDGDGQAKDDVA